MSPHRSRNFLLAGAIVVAVLVAYANSFRVPFLLDDRSAITENPTITKLGDIGAVLMPTKITTSGRPLLNLSFAINFAVGGQSVAGYHVVNILIHLAAALVVFGILRRTLVRRGISDALTLAFVSALLWAVHPLLTNAVTYVSQRAESMMGLFYLLTLYGLIRALDSPQHARWLAVSAASCFAGVLTKEVAVTAPFVVLLYDRVFCSTSFKAALSQRRVYYAVLALSWVLLVYLAVSTRLDERSVGTRAGADWWYYALTEAKVLVWYLKLALWPHPLVFDYGQEILERDFGAALPYAITVLVALGGTVFLFVRGAKGLGFLAATFFVILSPTSSFLPVVGQPMAESRLYLPLIPIAVLVVLALHRFFRSATWMVGGAIAVILCLLTLQRNQDYASALRLWEDTVAKQPKNSRGQYNFANELLKHPARAAEAIGHYEEALRLKPDLVDAHNNLANELAKSPARAAEALAHYDKALVLRPDLVEAQANAARLLGEMRGRLPDAVARWEQLLAAHPEMAEAHFYLGNDLARMPGRSADAVAHYEAALRLRPKWVEAHNNLANELAKSPDQLPEAIAHYEEALRIKPDYAEAHCNLANKLARLPGRMPEALEHYETALRLKPEFLEAHYNYANKLAALGRWADAVAHYEAALRINPNIPEAHKNLALALANLGRFGEAVSHLESALALRPDYAEARALLEQVKARM